MVPSPSSFCALLALTARRTRHVTLAFSSGAIVFIVLTIAASVSLLNDINSLHAEVMEDMAQFKDFMGKAWEGMFQVNGEEKNAEEESAHSVNGRLKRQYGTMPSFGSAYVVRQPTCNCVARANRCPPGSPGPPGMPGIPGEPGMRGQDGIPGLPGMSLSFDIGYQGCVQCPPGAPGVQGPQGISGQPGPDGQPGASGTNGGGGYSGPPGEPGEPGPAGPPGNNGSPGQPGQAGQTGKGLRGCKGPIGPTGPIGQPGQPGPPAATGAQGQMGRIGSPGLNGNIGSSGSMGSPGLNGVPGQDAGYCPCPSRAQQAPPYNRQ